MLVAFARTDTSVNAPSWASACDRARAIRTLERKLASR